MKTMILAAILALGMVAAGAQAATNNPAANQGDQTNFMRGGGG